MTTDDVTRLSLSS